MRFKERGYMIAWAIFGITFIGLLIIVICLPEDRRMTTEEKTEIYESIYGNKTVEEVINEEIDRQIEEEQTALSAEIHEQLQNEVKEELKEAKYLYYCPNVPLEAREQSILFDSCREWGVPIPFALAIIESESTFRLDATGYKDGEPRYIGAWQISTINAEQIFEDYGLDIYDETENLIAGCAFVGKLIEKYDDLEYVLQAFKGGESAAAKWESEGFQLECVPRIMERMDYWYSVLGDVK